jgi:UDPglucose 6-dehydrogenase
VNVTVVGGKGKLGSVIAGHIANFYPVRVADRAGGEPTAESTRTADIVIVIVDTPSLPDGQYDVLNVVSACAEIDLRRWRLVAVSSTVNPGDTEGPIRAALERDGKRAHCDFGLAYVPEFVRQGSVLEDFARPEFVIAGCATILEEAALNEFYDAVCKKLPTFMSVESAEIAKLGLNTALTAKMGKANEIAWLCQRTPGADALDVLRAVGMDPRVGPLYFKPGPPDGGPCFPRDNRAFAKAMERAGVSPILTVGVDHWRRAQFKHMADLVRADLPPGGKAGVAGLSFKAGVSDMTESPGEILAQVIGPETETFDPAHLSFSTCKTLGELIDKCDVIVLAMPFKGDWSPDQYYWGDTVVWDWWGMFGDKFNRFGKGLETC